MTTDEAARIERAMDRQADKIGAEIRSLGEKMSKIGERTARVETRLEDHINERPITGQIQIDQANPWKILAYVLLGLGGAGAAGGGISQLF